MKFEGWTTENVSVSAKCRVYRFLNEASVLSCILASFIFKYEFASGLFAAFVASPRRAWRRLPTSDPGHRGCPSSISLVVKLMRRGVLRSDVRATAVPVCPVWGATAAGSLQQGGSGITVAPVTPKPIRNTSPSLETQPYAALMTYYITF